MTMSEFLLILIGIVQYFLFAFAQEAMMLGASKQYKFVDPTANMFGIRDVMRGDFHSRTGIVALCYVYVDFFRGFISFFKFVTKNFIATFRVGAKDFLNNESFLANDLEFRAEFERKTLNKLRFYIYLFNSMALIILSIGVIFAIMQRGPETYVRPIDLFLIVSFNVFTISCLILAYEARVQILRGRYGIIISKLMSKRRVKSNDDDLDKILDRLSEVVKLVDADVRKANARRENLRPQDEVLPKSVESKIQRLAASPADAEKFLLDNNLILSDKSD